MSISYKQIQQFVFRLLIAVTFLPAAFAQSDTYPDRPIRWIVPFAAGGPTDAIARVIAHALPQQLNGTSVAIENKPGGATVIGTQAMSTANPDGYTIASLSDNLAINELLLPKVPYKFTDFEYVAGLIKMPMVLALRSDLPPSNLQETLQYFKENNGKLSYGTWGPGSGAHLTSERLADLLGVNFVHIPFQGSAPAINALLAKQIDFVVLDLATVLQHAKTGKVKIVAVTTKTRSPSVPNAPALAEVFDGFDAFTWNGVAAPKGTPQSVVRKLTAALHQTLRQPQVQKDLQERGMTIWASDAQELKSRLFEESRTARQTIEKRGIRLE